MTARRCQCSARVTCTPTTLDAAMDHVTRHAPNGKTTEQIAADLDMSAGLLRRQTNPDDRDNHFPLRKFLRFLKATGSHLPLDVLCREEGGVFIQLPEVTGSNEALRAATLAIATELGEAAMRVNEAAAAESDGGTAITFEEAERGGREFDDIAAKAMTAKALLYALAVPKPAMVRMHLDPAATRRSA